VEALEEVNAALKIDAANTDAKALETTIQAAIRQQRADEQRRQDEKRQAEKREEQRAAEARVKETAAVTTPSATTPTKGQTDETVLLNMTPTPAPVETVVVRSPSPVAPAPVALSGVSLPVPPLLPVSRAPAVGPAVTSGTATTADTTAPPKRVKYAAMAAAALVVVAVIGWFVTRPAPPPPPPPPALPGTVVFDIAPWATIESITNKADGMPVQSDCRETPCVLSLPPGEYGVRASNPNFPGTLQFDVTIESGSIREEHLSIPGFRPEDEVSKILDGKN
jgi:hypothetical protein